MITQEDKPIEFYHANSAYLRKGSILEVGNYGRMMESYQYISPSRLEGSFITLYEETVFEMIRQQFYKDKPSRWNCIFVCETLSELRLYLNQTLHVYEKIYKVKPLKQQYNSHKTKWSLINRGNYGLNIPLNSTNVERAHMYWKDAQNDQQHEILIDSPVEIVDVL